MLSNSKSIRVDFTEDTIKIDYNDACFYSSYDFAVVLCDFLTLLDKHNKQKIKWDNIYCYLENKHSEIQTRGSQEPVIAHLVFNLTSKVDRKWGCYT